MAVAMDAAPRGHGRADIRHHPLGDARPVHGPAFRRVRLEPFADRAGHDGLRLRLHAAHTIRRRAGRPLRCAPGRAAGAGPIGTAVRGVCGNDRGDLAVAEPVGALFDRLTRNPHAGLEQRHIERLHRRAGHGNCRRAVRHGADIGAFPADRSLAGRRLWLAHGLSRPRAGLGRDRGLGSRGFLP